jgi:hypothetical protein
MGGEQNMFHEVITLISLLNFLPKGESFAQICS